MSTTPASCRTLCLCPLSLSLGRGLADSCETDRQEAAQRNRCTVMVAAAVVGGLHPPVANSNRMLLASWLTLLQKAMKQCLLWLRCKHIYDSPYQYEPIYQTPIVHNNRGSLCTVSGRSKHFKTGHQSKLTSVLPTRSQNRTSKITQTI